MTLEAALSFIAGVNSLLMSGLTFLVGLMLGHWLQLGREKRQEWNEAVAPVRAVLLHELERPTPMDKRPSKVELDRLESKLGWLRLRRFRAALKACADAQDNTRQDNHGQSFYVDEAAVQAALRRLLEQIQER